MWMSFNIVAGDSAFDFTCLLHTYLAVDDVTKCPVSGLRGLQYVDKVINQTQYVVCHMTDVMKTTFNIVLINVGNIMVGTGKWSK